MSEPGQGSADRPHPRGLRILDIIGFVAGFGLAALLTRTVWPRSVELSGAPAVALALEYSWLGLAMSGPIILGLDPHRAPRTPPPRPARPGRLIGDVTVVSRFEPQVRPAADLPRLEYTRAELAWMAIGGYWIALTFLVVPARTTSAPWTLAGLVPIVAVGCFLRLIPRRATRTGDPQTHWAGRMPWVWACSGPGRWPGGCSTCWDGRFDRSLAEMPRSGAA